MTKYFANITYQPNEQYAEDGGFYFERNSYKELAETLKNYISSVADDFPRMAWEISEFGVYLEDIKQQIQFNKVANDRLEMVVDKLWVNNQQVEDLINLETYHVIKTNQPEAI